MKLPRTILFLLVPSIFFISCEASSSFRPLPAVAASSALSPLMSSSFCLTRRRRRRRNNNRQVAFMVVPRGGSTDDYASDLESEEHTNDDLPDCDDTENNSDEAEDYMTSSADEADDHDHLPANFDPNILSPAHLASLLSSAVRHRQSITSAMVHYASLFLRVTRRACLAGARAVMSMDDDEFELSGRGLRRSEEKNGGGNKPMVHTLIGRTVHVLEEMYHAALMPDGLEAGEVENDGEANQSGIIQEGNEASVKKRIRRRHRHGRRHNNETKRHHRHRHHHEQHRHVTSTPKAIKVISNGGGMEPASHNHHDAILRLAKLYNTKLPTDDDTNGPSLSNKYDSVLLSSHTSINEALQMANSNARFLICYISKHNNKGNTIAIPNLLSPEMVKLANRRALGKKQTGDYSSFYIWIANDDAHVDASMKRLGVKPPKRQSSKKNKKSIMDTPLPILAIIYPATTIDPSSGRPRISSRVLAQHHCNPPPTTSEILSSWANSVRKRHLREYAKLQHVCTEMQLLRERNRGYVGSIQEDEAREAKEVKDRQQQEEEAAKERDRLKEIEARRQVLLESLAEEPPMGTTPPEDVITIALRFNDGNKRDQRRFLADETHINDVCNWIDARHGIEREKLELSTMNGARKFVYVENSEEDMTLREAGLAKMTALRVAEVESAVADKEEEDEIVDEEDEAVEEKEEDEELDEDDEEEEDDEDEDEDEEE